MNFADVGDGISIGSFDACDALRDRFSLIIHISHPDPNGGGRCQALTDHLAQGMSIHYSDGESLTKASVPMERVVAYARQDSALFIHCAWAVCRSPTFAVLCKVARGCDPVEAMAEVARATWTGYRVAPQFMTVPLTEILRWHFEKEGRGE